MALVFMDGVIYTAPMGRPLGSKNKTSSRQKFASYYVVDEITGCWVWQRSRNNKGYGYFRQDGHEMAHRWAYEEFNDLIPVGGWVLHSCDNPACVNPDHLFLGNAQVNVDDMIDKGRHYAKGKTLEELWGAEGAVEVKERLRQGRLAKPISLEARKRQGEKMKLWWARRREGFT